VPRSEGSNLQICVA